MRGCVSFSEVFEDFFNVFAHFEMGDLWVSTLAYPAWVFCNFWPKSAWPLCPPSLFNYSDFFVCFPGWKNPQRERVCWYRISKTKNCRSTKGHQNWSVQRLFWTVEKNISKDVLHQMESTFKVTEVKHVRISTQYFTNKFWFGGMSPHIIHQMFVWVFIHIQEYIINFLPW